MLIDEMKTELRKGKNEIELAIETGKLDIKEKERAIQILCLKLSIKKWKDICSRKGINHGIYNCACCAEYRPESSFSSQTFCKGCPIAQAYGMGCKNLNMSNEFDTLSKLEKLLETLVTPPAPESKIIFRESGKYIHVYYERPYKNRLHVGWLTAEEIVVWFPAIYVFRDVGLTPEEIEEITKSCVEKLKSLIRGVSFWELTYRHI